MDQETTFVDPLIRRGEVDFSKIREEANQKRSKKILRRIIKENLATLDRRDRRMLSDPKIEEALNRVQVFDNCDDIENFVYEKTGHVASPVEKFLFRFRVLGNAGSSSSFVGNDNRRYYVVGVYDEEESTLIHELQHTADRLTVKPKSLNKMMTNTEGPFRSFLANMTGVVAAGGEVLANDTRNWKLAIGLGVIAMLSFSIGVISNSAYRDAVIEQRARLTEKRVG